MKIDAGMEGVEELDASIQELKNKWASSREIVWVVGTSVEYSLFVEFGTRPHEITPDDQQALHFVVDGEEVFTKHVEHPGTEPQPYMRPAAEQTKARMGEIAGRANSYPEAMEMIARSVEEIAKQYAPVDTGTLRASIGARQVK